MVNLGNCHINNLKLSEKSLRVFSVISENMKTGNLLSIVLAATPFEQFRIYTKFSSPHFPTSFLALYLLIYSCIFRRLKVLDYRQEQE